MYLNSIDSYYIQNILRSFLDNVLSIVSPLKVGFRFFYVYHKRLWLLMEVYL